MENNSNRQKLETVDRERSERKVMEEKMTVTMATLILDNSQPEENNNYVHSSNTPQ